MPKTATPKLLDQLNERDAYLARLILDDDPAAAEQCQHMATPMPQMRGTIAHIREHAAALEALPTGDEAEAERDRLKAEVEQAERDLAEAQQRLETAKRAYSTYNPVQKHRDAREAIFGAVNGCLIQDVLIAAAEPELRAAGLLTDDGRLIQPERRKPAASPHTEAANHYRDSINGPRLTRINGIKLNVSETAYIVSTSEGGFVMGANQLHSRSAFIDRIKSATGKSPDLPGRAYDDDDAYAAWLRGMIGDEE